MDLCLVLKILVSFLNAFLPTPFLPQIHAENNSFSSFQVWKHWPILLHPTCLKRMVNSYWTEDLTLVPSNPTRVLLPLWSSRKQQVVPVPECKCTERVWCTPMPGMPSKPKKLPYNEKSNLYLTFKRPQSLYQYTFWRYLLLPPKLKLYSYRWDPLTEESYHYTALKFKTTLLTCWMMMMAYCHIT